MCGPAPARQAGRRPRSPGHRYRGCGWDSGPGFPDTCPGYLSRTPVPDTCPGYSVLSAAIPVELTAIGHQRWCSRVRQAADRGVPECGKQRPVVFQSAASSGPCSRQRTAPAHLPTCSNTKLPPVLLRGKICAIVHTWLSPRKRCVAVEGGRRVCGSRSMRSRGFRLNLRAGQAAPANKAGEPAQRNYLFASDSSTYTYCTVFTDCARVWTAHRRRSSPTPTA